MALQLFGKRRQFALGARRDLHGTSAHESLKPSPQMRNQDRLPARDLALLQRLRRESPCAQMTPPTASIRRSGPRKDAPGR